MVWCEHEMLRRCRTHTHTLSLPHSLQNKERNGSQQRNWAILFAIIISMRICTLMEIISWCRVLMILYHHQSFHLQRAADCFYCFLLTCVTPFLSIVVVIGVIVGGGCGGGALFMEQENATLIQISGVFVWWCNVIRRFFIFIPIIFFCCCCFCCYALLIVISF